MASSPSTFTLAEVALPLRSLPPDTFLVHATNCLGQWGAGIALELRGIFPAAFAVYKTFCDSFKPNGEARYAARTLAGRCLIIPPQETDIARGAPTVYVVCVFTSYGYGRANRPLGKPGLDGPSKVLEQTALALEDFRKQLDGDSWKGAGHTASLSPGGDGLVVYSPRFNSGAFKVPWEQTEAMINATFRDWSGRWIVLTPP